MIALEPLQVPETPQHVGFPQPGALRLIQPARLPKMLARRLLPSGFDLNRKQGFGIPLARWFKDGWVDFVAGVLSEADPGLFDRKAVSRLLDRKGIGFSNESRLFGLTMFELWRRHYAVSA